jgi:hypothetical protein
MNRTKHVLRVFTLALLFVAVLVSSSCETTVGVGVGVGYPARWGAGGTTGPPIFVGGPAYN